MRKAFKLDFSPYLDLGSWNIELYRFQLYGIVLEHGRSLAGLAADAKGVDIVNFDCGV